MKVNDYFRIQCPVDHHPLIIAHQGASGYLPEHTLESYQLGIDMGADFIEQDVVITKDGVLVIHHENEIGDTTDAAERFPERRTTKVVDGLTVTGWFTEDFTLEELKSLRVKQRVKNRDQQYNGRFQIPTLEEVIQLGLRTGVGIYPELKHPTYFRNIGLPLEDRFLELLNRYGLNRKSSPIIVQSFEPSVLQYIHERSNVRIIQLIEDLNDTKYPRPYDYIYNNIPTTYPELLKPESLKLIRKYADIIGPYKNDLRNNPAIIKAAHDAGLQVHSWTFRNDRQWTCEASTGCEAYKPFKTPEEEISYFRNLGIDGYFTDYPDTLRRVLCQWNQLT